MICPCCSFAEVSKEADVCELCGYSIAANVATKSAKAGPRVSSADPARSVVKVAGTGTTGAGTAIAITLCDRKGRRLKSGGDIVVVAVTGANRGRPAVTDVGNGTYTATYTPVHAGPDRLAITVNGIPVEGSPFQTVVAPGRSDPARTTAKVPGGTAGRITAIVVTARDASGNTLTGGGEILECTITGSNAGAPVTITDGGGDTYTANYVPERSGTDEVTVTIGGREISGSPFESTVQAGPAEAAQTSVGMPGTGTPGQAITVMITARDQYGNRVRRGGDAFSVEVSGANKGLPSTTDVGNGTYTATYAPTSVGTDKVAVKLNRRSVEGSPFSVTIAAGAADPLQTTAAVPVALAGQAAEVMITARDAHGNRLKSGGDAVKVRIRGANRLTPDVEDFGDGTYAASYVPTAAGTDQISIEVNGTEINGSPFDGAVEPGPMEPANAVVLGDAHARAGDVYTCSVSARDSYNNVLHEGGRTIDATIEGVNAGRPVDVADNDDGTYSCAYVPTRCGLDQLNFTADGEPINAEPFAVTVTPGRPAAKHTIAQVADGSAGETTKILVTTRDEFGNDAADGGHMVDVVVVGSNEDAAVTVTDLGDGTYEAAYRPTATGTDYISVNLDAAVIGDSPVVSNVGPGATDPDRTLATLPSVCRAGSRANLFVTAMDAFDNPRGTGGDKVVVTLTEKDHADEATVVDQKNGTYLAYFTPRQTGDGEIVVTINGKQIADSPLEYHVVSGAVDPLQTVARGLDAGCVGLPYTITIITRDQYGNPSREPGHTVAVLVTGSNDGMEATVVDNHDGTHRATYVPKRPGRDRIAITIDGKPIGGEPLRPVVGVGGASMHSTAEVPGGKAGKVTTITVTARDAAGNETRVGGDRVNVEVSVANSAKPQAVDHGDGTYTASYTPTATGTDYVAMTINGAPLVGSPFQSRIVAGPTDAVQTVANVPPSTVAGHTSEITISMRDVHGNEVTHGGQMVRVSVEGANDDRSLKMTDNQDGTFTARYTPTKAGRDHVAIGVNGKSVGGGAFTSVIKPDTPSVAQTTAQVPPATVGSMTTLTVTLRDGHRNRVAGSDALRVELDGANAGTPLQMTDNRDGTYTVTYVPTIAGTDKLCVFVGDEQVRESPFAGTVSAGRAASDRTVALVPDGRAGDETLIHLTARDAYGNPLATQDGVDVAIKGANDDAPVQVKDREDGTYELTYRPVVAGVDRIIINVNGTLIRGGPFTSTVEPGWVDSTHCTATVPAGTVGIPSTLSVLARDVYDNDITVGGASVDVQVTGSNVGTPVQVTDRGNGTYQVVYTPMAAGTDDIAVTVNGHPVGGSPFSSRIVAGRIETGAPGPAAGVMSNALHAGRRALQPTMICPRCSASEISPDSHQCELCGLVLLNVLVPRSAVDSILDPFEEVEKRGLDDRERMEADLGHTFHLESVLRQSPGEITYLAKNRIDAQRGVLKAVARESLDDAGIAEFEREIDRVRDLRHAHVVTIRAHGVTDSCVWYWSEYVPGRTFADVMRESGPMDLDTCVNWMEQVAGALDYVHRRGIVHGNLKPSNVLVDSENWARVTDPFLIPKDLTGAHVERSSYLAPEQLEVDPVSAATDQYALALLAYTCLTGKEPFAGANGREARELRRRTPPSVLEHRPSLPPNVAAAIDRALQPSPADRFTRITDFVEALGPGQVTASAVVESSRALEGQRESRGELPRIFVIQGPPRAFPVAGIVGGAAAVLLVVFGLRMTGQSPTAVWSVVNPVQDAMPVTTSSGVSPEPAVSTLTPAEAPADSGSPEPVAVATNRPPVDVPQPPVVADTTPVASPPPVVAPPVRVDSARPAPPAPARFGMLSLTSTPAAPLFIDGRPVGRTPSVDLPMDPGPHTISIQLFGYVPFEREITIVAGESLTIPNVVLRPIR